MGRRQRPDAPLDPPGNKPPDLPPVLARFARRTTVAFQVPDDATGILFTTAGLLDACRRLPMALAQDANPPGLIRWWLDLPDRLGGSGGEVPGLRVVERFRERLTPIEPLGRTLVDRVARVRGRQPAPLTAADVTAAGVIAAGQVTLRQELPGAASPLVPAGRNPELVGRLSDQASRIAGHCATSSTSASTRSPALSASCGATTSFTRHPVAVTLTCAHRDAWITSSRCRLWHMRTTVVLDNDVAAAVAALRRQRAVGVSEAVNTLVRAGLQAKSERKAFEQRTHHLGLRVDVTNVAEALEQLDGPDHP